MIFTLVYNAPFILSLPSPRHVPRTAGEGEGCAYRGRALVALRTSVGEYPNVATEPLDFEEGLKIDVSTAGAVLLRERKGEMERDVAAGGGGWNWIGWEDGNGAGSCGRCEGPVKLEVNCELCQG